MSTNSKSLNSGHPPRRKENRIMTLLIEILFGILVAVGAVLYAAHGPFPWMPQRKWIVLAIVSSTVFGVPAWSYRRHWRHANFWILLGGLLFVHILAYSTILGRLKEFPPLVVPISIPLEWLIIFPIMRKFSKKQIDRV